MFAYFGSLCVPSISAFSKLYAYLSLRRRVALPILFLIVVTLITYINILLLTFLTAMGSHMCFIGVHFSGGKSITRVLCIVVFVTPNPPTRSE